MIIAPALVVGNALFIFCPAQVVLVPDVDRLVLYYCRSACIPESKIDRTIDLCGRGITGHVHGKCNTVFKERSILTALAQVLIGEKSPLQVIGERLVAKA